MKESGKTIVGAILAAVLLVLSLNAAGMIDRQDSTAHLEQRLDAELEGCMVRKGINAKHLVVETGDIQNRTAKYKVNEQCWTETLASGKYASIDISAPSHVIAELRVRNFKNWRCVESAGYRRETPIPLSGLGGYPLLVTAGHFDVEHDSASLKRFYSSVSKCSHQKLSVFLDPDGHFIDQRADGNACVKHTHGGIVGHSHGCFVADEYPKGTQ